MSDKYIGELPEHPDQPEDGDQAVTWDTSEPVDAKKTKRLPWVVIKAWVRGIVAAAGTQIVTALSALAGNDRLEASAIRGLPSAGGATLIGKGDVTTNTANAVDTGVDWPNAIDADDLFAVCVHNRATHQHSGSIVVTGDLVLDLSDWSVGEAEGNANTFACDQGDRTDNEYFLGRSSSGDLLISVDVGNLDDLRVSLWKLN